MGRSVAEVRKSLEENQCRMAVWEKIVDFLSACLDTETREAPGKVLLGNGQAVPQGLIEGVIQDIEAEKVSPIRGEIKNLENLQVMETKNGNQQGERAATGAQQKVQKRVRVLAKPG